MTALLAMFAMWINPASAQTQGDSVSERRVVELRFRIGESHIDSTYATNRGAMQQLRHLADSSRSGDLRLERMVITGSASPDGLLGKNRTLARERGMAMRDYLVDSLGVGRGLLEPGDTCCDDAAIDVARAESWAQFRKLVDETPFEGSSAVAAIAGEGSDKSATDNGTRLSKLKGIDEGRVWERLCADYLPQLRYARLTADVTAFRGRADEAVAEAVADTTERVDMPAVPDCTEAEVAETAAVAEDDEQRCYGRWYLKTSVPAWAAAVANVAAEYDFGCHWSAALTLAYSAWDYGTVTRKFRTFVFRPELRYWPGTGHRGVFVEGHLAMMSYNVALPGWQYRIQDRKGTHPALGGGVGVGYRLALGRGERWWIEAAAGVGAYSLNYDRFENRRNGALVDTKRRFFFGVDHVAVSVVYTLNLNNK